MRAEKFDANHIALQPLTLIALSTLWAFPLGGLLWGERRTNLTSLPTWGFLEQPTDPIHLPTQSRMQIYPVLKTGLVCGLIYCGLLLVLRLGIRILLPESMRDSDGFKIVLLYAGYIGLAALMQAGIALKVFRQTQSFQSVQGLFAAFTAGCVMALGVLLINLLIGGTIDPQFIWTTFSMIVNWGSLPSLLGMMICLPQDRAKGPDSNLRFEI